MTGEAVYQPAEHAAPSQRMVADGAVESSVTFSVVTLELAGVHESLTVTPYAKSPPSRRRR